MSKTKNATTYSGTRRVVPPSPIGFFNPNVDPTFFSDEKAIESANYILRCGDVCDNEVFVMNYIAGREAIVRKLLSRRQAKKVGRLLAWRRDHMMAEFEARAEGLAKIKDQDEWIAASSLLAEEYGRIMGHDAVLDQPLTIAKSPDETMNHAVMCASWLIEGTRSKTLNEAFAKISSLDEKSRTVLNQTTFAVFGSTWDEIESLLKQTYGKFLDQNVPIYCTSIDEAIGLLAA